jgi:hypothetical protein
LLIARCCLCVGDGWHFFGLVGQAGVLHARAIRGEFRDLLYTYHHVRAIHRRSQ